MKKFICYLIILLSAILLTACKKEEARNPSQFLPNLSMLPGQSPYSSLAPVASSEQASMSAETIKTAISQIDGVEKAAVVTCELRAIIAVKINGDYDRNVVKNRVQIAAQGTTSESCVIAVTEDEQLFTEIEEAEREAPANLKEKMDAWFTRLRA